MKITPAIIKVRKYKDKIEVRIIHPMLSALEEVIKRGEKESINDNGIKNYNKSERKSRKKSKKDLVRKLKGLEKRVFSDC